MANVLRRSRIGGYSALLIYLGLGLAGGVAGVACAALVFPLAGQGTLESTDPFLSAASMLIAAAAVGGGVVAGWFVAAIIVSRAPGQLLCPRCGTANEPRARSCRGCGLSFE